MLGRDDANLSDHASSNEDASLDFERRVRELYCRVEMPAGWLGDTPPHGHPLPVSPTDGRRHVRYQFRTVGIMTCTVGLPTLTREPDEYVVFTKNVSRHGIAFLHEEQLYPTERVDLWLPDGQKRQVQVMRCQKLAPRCYEVGASFV